VYKLQDCKTLKTKRAWVHANRLKRHDDSREKFYTRTLSSTKNTLQWPFTDELVDSCVADSRKNTESNSGSKHDKNGNTSQASSTLAEPSTEPSRETSKPDNESDWYEVLRIDKHRRQGRDLEYLVI